MPVTLWVICLTCDEHGRRALPECLLPQMSHRDDQDVRNVTGSLISVALRVPHDPQGTTEPSQQARYAREPSWARWPELGKTKRRIEILKKAAPGGSEILPGRTICAIFGFYFLE
jgi:hypothetical protein